MRRGLAFGGAVLLGLSAVLLQWVALPRPALACSCVAPLPTLEEFVEQAGGGIAVITGTVGAPLPETTPVVVEAWFFGAAPQDVVWISGGSNVMSSCDRMLGVGERHLLVLYGPPGERYSTNVCARGASLDTQEGQALLAEAVALFGTGEPPPTAEPAPEQPLDLSPLAGPGMLWVLAGGLAALAVFGLVTLAARRRQLS
jgi:hypothetical protein